MTNQTLAMTPTLYGYYLSVAVREHPILKALRAKTAALPNGNMQIAPEQGQFMAFLVEMLGARRTLEIGTFTGYSALAIALALPMDGRVITCDINEAWTSIAREFWQNAGVAHKIELRLGPALETLDAMIKNGQQQSFDFAFIDADKANNQIYYEKALQLLRRGGVIAIDNVFWEGEVANTDNQQQATRDIRQLNAYLHQDQRVSLSIVPIGDGLTLVRKR